MLVLLQAANYDPNALSDSGTCTYLYEDPETGKKTEGDLRDFVTTTVGSLFGGNKSDTSGPNWEGTGYAYSGDKVSQRDIERLVSVPCLLVAQLHGACTFFREAAACFHRLTVH